MKQVRLKSRNGEGILLGNENPIVVNLNVGINSDLDFESEKVKIDALFVCVDTAPDLMMDLSIVRRDNSLAEYIMSKYYVPVGIVPVYTLVQKDDINMGDKIN